MLFLAAVLMGAVDLLPAPRVDRLDRLDEAEAGDPHPPGWTVETVRGAATPTSSVVQDGEKGPVLRVEARHAAAFYGLELDREGALLPDRGRLEWSWRVDVAMGDVVLGRPGLDDSPARFFVLFGRGGIFSRPRAIFYTWGWDEPRDSTWIQEGDHGAAVVVLRGREDALGTWHTEERNLAADYRRAFGEGEPEPVSGMGLLVDTDDTGLHAESRLGPIRWKPLEGGGPGVPERLGLERSPDLRR